MRQHAVSTDLNNGGRSANESTTRLRLLPGDLLREVPPDHALLIHQTLPPAHLQARPYYGSRRLRALSSAPLPPLPDTDLTEVRLAASCHARACRRLTDRSASARVGTYSPRLERGTIGTCVVADDMPANRGLTGGGGVVVVVREVGRRDFNDDV